MLSDVYSGQCFDALFLLASVHPVPLGFLPRGLAHGQNCSDALASVYPVPTGSGAHAPVYLVPLTFAEPIHFFISLSSFFMFCFAWSFCFILGIYKSLLDKLISSIDCVVTQSLKSQNNGLMGPFFLHQSILKFWFVWSLEVNLLEEKKKYESVTTQQGVGAHTVVVPRAGGTPQSI